MQIHADFMAWFTKKNNAGKKDHRARQVEKWRRKMSKEEKNEKKKVEMKTEEMKRVWKKLINKALIENKFHNCGITSTNSTSLKYC